ncbi:MAG: hypothetical protein F6K31_43050, partial [Symploca sp. SIO2G7]|nr:hypothetical protein [Symploca sp. SIO2G7]
MALPNKFSETEFLQDVFKRLQNRAVTEWFRDLGSDEWESEIKTPRGQYRTACTHKESDSVFDTLLRIEAFKRIQEQEKYENITVFGYPENEINFSYAPQILLYFSQPSLDVVEDGSYARARIHFRWKGKTKQNISNFDLTSMANKIKSIFAKDKGGYVLHKGKKFARYNHKDQGYQLQILCLNEAE